MRVRTILISPPQQAPCVRLVVASKFYLNLGGSNGITLYRSIYRAGINQGIFARRQDNQVGRGRVERQLAYGKKLDEKEICASCARTMYRQKVSALATGMPRRNCWRCMKPMVWKVRQHAWCRENGLFAHHLTSWKAAFCADGKASQIGRAHV